MTKLESLKNELEDVNGEIECCNEELDKLESSREYIKNKIELYEKCEKLEPFVLAALNLNYNRWCSRAYLEKTIRWDETDLEPDDEDNIEKAIAACETLVEKGIIQRKETGSYDDELDPICEYRITDTETIDMFENLEEKHV